MGALFATAMGDVGRQGYTAILNVDWANLGSSTVNAIVSGLGSAAGALGAKLSEMASSALSSAKSAIFGGGGGGSTVGISPNKFNGWKGGGIGGLPVAGTRALGGPVCMGLSYLVGERGPEIFTPPGSGRIETNGALGRLASASGVVEARSRSGKATSTSR